MKLDFTKDEVEYFKSKCYFSDEELKILELRLENNLTIQGIALKMNLSERTVNRRIKSIKKKIKRVN